MTGILSGDGLRPTVVENILRQPDYQTFHNELEHGPHKEIPNGIGGDFMTFAAPSDPLWYLHHRYVCLCHNFFPHNFGLKNTR